MKDERTNGLPLSEKQGVGSSILPLATINIGSVGFHRQTEKTMADPLTKTLNNLILK